MSVLAALDATRICAGKSGPLPDAAWIVPAPVVARRPAAPRPPVAYSWWCLVRNPQAVLVTGVVGALVAKNTLLELLAG